jgi:hypothetical protein
VTREEKLALKFFVVRVILHQPSAARKRPVRYSDMTTPAQLAVLAMVKAGDLCQLPCGAIAEGVKEHTNEVDAHKHREQLASRHPGEDFRVIIETAQALG